LWPAGGARPAWRCGSSTPASRERLFSTARLDDGLALALERGHREIDVLPTYTALEEVRVTLAAERRAG
jgi:hypothetical protein